MRVRAFFSSIYGQVLVATIIGVAVGQAFPEAGTAMKPLGDGFIKLVRMIVGPIIFCTVVGGIAGAGEPEGHRPHRPGHPDLLRGRQHAGAA